MYLIKSKQLVFLLSWCAALIAAIPTAQAALGEPPLRAGQSAQADARIAIFGVGKAGLGYTVYSSEFNNGTVVQEYVDRSGTVFALRWSGPEMPDLAVLLGNYLPVFNAAIQASKAAGKRGGPVMVQSNGLVLSSNGRMQAFTGYAYLERLVPAGLDLQALLR